MHKHPKIMSFGLVLTICAIAVVSCKDIDNYMRYEFHARHSLKNDLFGYSIAASNALMVAGAPGNNSPGRGINENEHLISPASGDSGAAYVFVRHVGRDRWTRRVFFKASNADKNDLFGSAVDIDMNNSIAVGAPGEDSGSIQINEGLEDNTISNSGAVYVFRHDNLLLWEQTAYLKAPNGDTDDGFGHAIAFYNNILAIGAPFEDSCSVLQPENNLCPDSGAVYLFRREQTGGYWSFLQYVKAPNPVAGDHFGWSVAKIRALLAVGAPNESGTGRGIDPMHTDTGAAASGAVHIYRNSGRYPPNQFNHEVYLKASNADPDDRFGTSVRLSTKRIVVGAPGESSGSSSSNWGHSDNSAPSAGAVYVFHFEDYYTHQWYQMDYLKALHTDAGDLFGSSVAINQYYITVGAPGEDSAHGFMELLPYLRTSVNSIPLEMMQNNAKTDSGAAYVYRRSESTPFRYYLRSYIKSPVPGRADGFASDVTVSRDYSAYSAFFSAPRDDEEADSDVLGIWRTTHYNETRNSGTVFGMSRDRDAPPIDLAP